MGTDKSYSYEELLDSAGSFVWKTTGCSMRPLIRQGKDAVVIEKPKERLKKYDVALYKVDGKYLLHRVLDVCDGYYIIAGDNNTFLEKVPEERIIGVMTELLRDGKKYDLQSFKYRFYERNWCGRFKFKCACKKTTRAARRFLSRIYHKVFKK